LKKGVLEKILELFSLEKRLGFKKNYLKRQGAWGEHDQVTGLSRLASGRVRKGQGSDVTDWHNRKWVTALGRCRKGRRDEKRKAD
jgi:hypothetical protein